MTTAAERWVILELTSRAEGEDPDLVCQSIQSTVKGAEVFVPAAVTQIGDDRVVHYLVDGYAFVRRGEHKLSTILRLESTKYVGNVLTEPGGSGQHRQLSTVPNADIERMRAQIAAEVDQGICIGDKVRIISGPYRNIEARVVEEIPEFDQVQVFVSLRSKKSIVTLPRSFLHVVDRSPLSPMLSRLTALGIWTRAAKPIFDWEPRGWDRIQQRWGEYQQVTSLQQRGLHLYACTSFLQGAMELQLNRLNDDGRHLQQLHAWERHVRPLSAFVGFCEGGAQRQQLDALRLKLVELAWFEDVFRRIKQLRRDINVIAHRAAKRRKDGDQMSIQNVLVDGHNLAFRCLYAPGMSELTDLQGRPTGMILGFLKGLGALKKRHPDARIYVAWDGSSRRRKVMFPDYKANRARRQASEEGDAPAWEPMQFLRDFLPLIGVRQAINPDEEADDILATLARNSLNGQHNLIFTTDRDLLQLVSPTTLMLMPGAGSRKESLFDPEAVKKTFGVTPERMTQLRAFYGDSSDNIPGVPRVPKKVLRSLVQAHGSIEGVYKSGLTGVTRGQYERLRAAEPQVRINLTLMSLVDVPVSVTGPDVDPDAAVERLRELAIDPDFVVNIFFGRKTEAPEA